MHGRAVRPRRLLALTWTAALLAAAPLPAQAQSGVSGSDNLDPEATTNPLSYWTPQRIRNAEPLEIHPEPGFVPRSPPAAPAPRGPVETTPGSPPRVVAPPGAATVLAPPLDRAALAPALPPAVSSFGAYYTTARVRPAPSTADFYPLVMAGKLFFRDPKIGKNFICSGSVVAPRLIVTAGHCVAHPSTSASQRYFHKNFMFVPAYDNGATPFFSWGYTKAWVTNAWYASSGSVPNPQDVAMIVAADQQGYRIGDLTGWFGTKTMSLSANHITAIGYPANLDAAQMMEITNSQIFGDGGNNTYTIGTSMSGGASGGPWIQDFGVRPDGASDTEGSNYVVGVSSYGPTNATGYLGASQLDNRFTDLFNNACGAQDSGNC